MVSNQITFRASYWRLQFGGRYILQQVRTTAVLSWRSRIWSCKLIFAFPPRVSPVTGYRAKRGVDCDVSLLNDMYTPRDFKKIL